MEKSECHEIYELPIKYIYYNTNEKVRSPSSHKAKSLFELNSAPEKVSQYHLSLHERYWASLSCLQSLNLRLGHLLAQFMPRCWRS